jgi:SAM-dependent methyltransferase
MTPVLSEHNIDLSVTANHWDKQHFANEFLRGEWSFHPQAKARLHRLLGAPSREDWFCDRYLKGRKNLRALGIGVGTCTTELNILTKSNIVQYDLYDLSPVALDAGRKMAAELGVSDRARFFCEDIHKVDLAVRRYDVITFVASLHHIADLDGILKRCERALAPGGVLWAAEYIGPDYFDYPEEHRDLARRLWRALGPEVKKTWIRELQFPTVEEVKAADPTESAHSSQIPRAMQDAFAQVEIIPTYGTFAFILFWGLNPDALYETEIGREFVRTVMDLDTALIDSGALPHYFAYLIARKPTWRQSMAKYLGLRLR